MESERLELCQFTEADITAAYLGWLNDPLVVRYSNQRLRRHDAESARAYLRSFSGTDNMFVTVRTRAEGLAIGTMTAYLAVPHGTADVGIMIGERSQWGKGFGLEAWKLMVRHLFEARDLRKVTAGALRCNVGMVRIMEISGMHHEGTRFRQEIVDGEPEDILYFARFRP